MTPKKSQILSFAPETKAMMWVKGEDSIKIGMSEYVMKPGMIALVPPDTFYHIEEDLSAEESRCIVFDFAPSFFDRLMLPMTGEFALRVYLPGMAVFTPRKELFDLACEIMSQTSKIPDGRFQAASLNVIAFGALLPILQECEPLTHKQMVAARFIADASRHFHENRTVATYAENLDITPKHLTAVTKEVVGMKAGEIIARMKQMMAEKLLVQTSDEVRNIAEGLGFADPSSFGKFFRANRGCTPTEFRDAAKKRIQ